MPLPVLHFRFERYRGGIVEVCTTFRILHLKLEKLSRAQVEGATHLTLLPGITSILYSPGWASLKVLGTWVQQLLAKFASTHGPEKPFKV